jgi:cell volume regulation protein A
LASDLKSSSAVGGKGTVYIINHIRLEWDGLYPVLSIALVLLFFAICSRVGGNGFLGVYVAGLVVGNTTLIHRRSLRMFHDGIAWLLQIAMFLILGLQVFPSQLLTVAKVGLLLSLFLIVVARPLSVLAALLPFRFNIPDQMFISWAGLRGAAPIILATIAVTSNVPHSQTLFNTVFFRCAFRSGAGHHYRQSGEVARSARPEPESIKIIIAL